jgi:hypothetical protein
MPPSGGFFLACSVHLVPAGAGQWIGDLDLLG